MAVLEDLAKALATGTIGQPLGIGPDRTVEEVAAGVAPSPSSSTPASIGTASAGSSADYSRGDHVHAAQLADLSDVSSAAPTSGQVLAWGGSEWAPATPSAGPSPSSSTPASIGTASAGSSADYSRGDHVHAAQLADLSDVSSAAPTSGQVLAWGGSEWAPATPSAGPSPSSSTPASIGTAAPGVSADYSRADHVHAAQVTALGDRFQRLALQSFAEFADSTTRDIQTAIDAHTSGAAAVVLAGPGSYPGATVTIAGARANFALVGPAGQPYGGTVCSLSAGRGLTVGGTCQRIRVQNIQIEGLTTWNPSGAGVHRIDRCQLLGGLTVGTSWPAATQLVITDCTIAGTITIPAGFPGVVLFDRCDFTGATFSIHATVSPLQVSISSCSGLTSVPSPATLNAFNALGSSVQAFFNGAQGTSGQVLTSNGSGAAPTWTTVSGGSGLPTSQAWTIDFSPTSTSGPTLAASGWTLVGLTSSGLFADANGNVYELLTQTGTTSVGYFFPTAQTVTAAIPWEIEFDVHSSVLDGGCTIQANEGAGAGNYRWRMLYNAAGGSAGSWQHQGTAGPSNLSTPYDVQTNSRIVMGIQSEPRGSRAFFSNGQCVGLVNPSGNAAGSSGATDYPGLFIFGNSSSPAGATAITMRVYGARVLVNGRGTAPPYARHPWPPVQP